VTVATEGSEPKMTDAPTHASRRRTWWWIGGGVAIVLALAAALLFQPWLLFIDVRVDDDIPSAVASPSSTAVPGTAADSTDLPATSAPPAAPAGPIDLASGSFVSHEHETTGRVRIIEHPDGSRQLAIEGLETTNGPDVHVWLSAGPVVEGVDGWFTAGGHPYVDLGLIKGNQGNQLYDIPADVDLTAYPTVDLWCVQFSVSFGAAALTAG
jgi:hypothetical protein